ncbi:MAG: hypothetical protein KA174_10755 [Chitinophagales bacterium]|jgi:hypothetical protein|nr:hypothetical protein [Chitinophagales bacterium]
MTKSNFFTLIVIISSLLLTYSCGVCDPIPSDSFSFYLTKNNQNIFYDTSYHAHQIKLYDLNNNTSYQLPLQIDTSRRSDSITIFKTKQVYNYFDKNGYYEYKLEITPTQFINLSLEISKFKSRKCGSHYEINKVIYNNKDAVFNNNKYAFQINLD